MSGHGGKRNGAGRKKNAPNKASQARQAEVAATGATPLDVMLADMRFHHGLAEDEAAKGAGADKAQIGKHRAAARAAAKDAAPYVHPALKAVEVTGAGGGPVQTEEVGNEKLTKALALVMAEARKQRG